MEEHVLAGGHRETCFALAELRRQVIALRRHMSPQREAIGSLNSSKIGWIGEDGRLSPRETSDGLIRHLEEASAYGLPN